MTKYVLYYNRKYKRVGPLFQSVYKAAVVPLAKVYDIRDYIESNPINAGLLRWQHSGSKL